MDFFFDVFLFLGWAFVLNIDVVSGIRFVYDNVRLIIIRSIHQIIKNSVFESLITSAKSSLWSPSTESEITQTFYGVIFVDIFLGSTIFLSVSNQPSLEIKLSRRNFWMHSNVWSHCIAKTFLIIKKEVIADQIKFYEISDIRVMHDPRNWQLSK